MDLDLKGGKFTWFSNPRNGFVIREKIDMALVNWEWMSMYQNASLSLMSAVSSDHCPLILDVIPVHRVRKYFKFEAYWADHKDCSNVVKRGWCKEEQNGDEWDKISRNINNCKGELKKWSITFCNQVSIQNRVNIEEILGMPAWESPGKYLGLPAIWGRSLYRALAWIEEKIMNKLEG
ncbi:hypothetical protein Ahy_A01g003669 [Arachis hypogaea]|uniref:Endonuclease/exonuclease/phosphatase domain-containing protein n=1 Tax=Arachis hypogaea TaxID=3818 RepID=A0A445ETS1_ARAHY|nr:hypothetical protein Ahy_A01g003669 [Arachis hypogaea]